ncbi:MAG: DUF58 domain-containing protein [Mariprofundaceae bacterium]|nr:DUF58 domain-containing protein [Mariprofundaceae bacterium]
MSNVTQPDLKQLIALQQQVASLSVRRRHIRSPMAGAHLSRLRGRGMEIDEVRAYQAGDEVSSIDWRVTARTGTTHTKVFREERERPILICLDYRANMFFASRGVLKSVLATQAAALLAWHGMAHHDRLGGLLFSDDEHHEIKPKRGKQGVLQLLHTYCQAKVWSKRPQNNPSLHSFEETMQRLRRVVKTGSLVYILSDFRGLDEASIAHLAQLARHNDVVLISVFDTLEKNFPKAGNYPVFDGETYFNCRATSALQQQLAQQFQTRLSMLQALQQQHGIHHVAMATDDDVASHIREHLWAI